jgi:hypothetical protein
MIDVDKILPTAKQALEDLAMAQARKVDEAMRNKQMAEEEKKDLIARLSAPSGLSDEQALERAARIIRRAVEAGTTEVEVYRFPNTLCTDRGRAVNQAEPGWEKTLTGVPKEIYELWCRHFRERGYKLRAFIVDFPGGMPGDVAMTLSWA